MHWVGRAHVHEVARPQLSQAGRELPEQCTCSGFRNTLLAADELGHVPSSTVFHDQEYSPRLLWNTQDSDERIFVALQCAMRTQRCPKGVWPQFWREVRGNAYVLPAPWPSRSMHTVEWPQDRQKTLCTPLRDIFASLAHRTG